MSEPQIKPAAWMCPVCKARFVKMAPHLAPRICCARTHQHDGEPVLVREPLFTRDDLVTAMKKGAETALRYCDISLVNMPSDCRIENDLAEMLGEK